jgi:predicted xylan-binding protein with Ca-dependent carbohydrate-binding module
LSGAIYYEVLTSSGSVESPYTAVLPNGAAITAPAAIPPQTAGQVFSVQVAFNYVPIRANLKYSQGTTNPPTAFSTFASNPGITWDATGQIATIPISNGIAVPHYFQVEDTTTSSPLLSSELTYQIGSSGGGGIIPVTLPSVPGATQTYTVSPHLAQSGDVVRIANNPTSPTVTATSLPVTITDQVVSPPTISLSAPGTVQEASVGAGVTVTETITTTNLTGNVYEEVLTAAGTVETPYATVALVNGVAASSVHLATTGDTIQVVDNTASPTVTAVSAPVTITEPPVTAPPAVTIGSGSDTLTLQVSEDAWQGNAQFTVSVDGNQVGGTQTAVASHAAGQTQTFNVLGTFASGSHTATVNFLNGGSPAAERNLYVNSATIDNSAVPAATLSETLSGPKSFSFLAPGSSGSADVVTVNRPAALHPGLQTIMGTETDPSQSIFVEWNTTRIPALTDSGWVQTQVAPSGAFSASISINPGGATGALFYRIGSGATVAAWSGIPS